MCPGFVEAASRFSMFHYEQNFYHLETFGRASLPRQLILMRIPVSDWEGSWKAPKIELRKLPEAAAKATLSSRYY